MAACPSCGQQNPDGFAFCGFCTAPLAERPATGAVEERKVVTVLFCDLVGFTAALEREDPEDVRARTRPYHARLRQEIERHGGTVEKFVGDAVMAVFGAPVSHEDDAERAVLAGLRILRAIAELNGADPGLDLRVRIGINTGEAVVAIGARPEQGEGMVTGDVVNTASRIQGAAPVDAVAVGGQTYRATARGFEYEPLAPVSVKGKAEPVPLWRAKRSRSRLGSDVTRRYDAPLVGRELERPLLIGTFERAAQQRTMQMLTIVGEPGIGKTRLVGELLAHAEARPGLTRWRQGRCLPYGEGITFWALGEIVKAEAGILESDSVEVAAAKLEAAVPSEGPERPWLLQRLGPLVGIEATSPAERQELFTAWRRFLEGLAVVNPAVLVFEDLHWADEALLSFLEYLAEWSEGVPLLVLCTARPELYERHPGWGAGQRNAHTITLAPLSRPETSRLVAQLIAGAVLSPDTEQAILERAGGNPLYAEEFVRLLADRELDPGDDAIAVSELPDSVQALIAARLDTLPPERKSLLQDAAVLGKVFWVGGLAEIGNRDQGGLEPVLHELARKELVRSARTSSLEGETEYSFWHVLVRDVAYSQIPRAGRIRRHRSAAAWIERQAGERVEDQAEVLASHYLQALELAEAAGDAQQADELTGPARRFLALAGERALGLDTAQAESRLARALELCPAGHPDRPDLVVRWADAAFQAGRPREAANALDGILASLRARGETEATVRAIQLRARLAMCLGDGRQFVALATEAIALLEREPPGAALVAAHAYLAAVRCIAGDYADGIAAADRARALAEQLGLPEPARARAWRGWARAFLGDADGLAEMEPALAVLVEEGAENVGLQGNLAYARYPLRGPAASLADFERGIHFCEQRGLAGTGAGLASNCPRLLVDLGRPAEALELAGRLVATAESSGGTYYVIELRAVELATRLARGEHETSPAPAAWLVKASLASGLPDSVLVGLAAAAAALAVETPREATALLTELERTTGVHEVPDYARQLASMVRTALTAGDPALGRRLAGGLEPRYPLDEHALCAARAQLAEHDGDNAAAAVLYAEAAGRWHEFGNVPERAYALLGHGRCLRALDRPEAEPPLREARDLFAAMGYRPALAETDALLEQTAAAPAP